MNLKFRLFWSVAACINALVIGAAGGMTTARAADAAKGQTLDSIVQGAKKEGKLSWSTNLEEHEVKESKVSISESSVSFVLFVVNKTTECDTLSALEARRTDERTGEIFA